LWVFCGEKPSNLGHLLGFSKKKLPPNPSCGVGGGGVTPVTGMQVMSMKFSMMLHAITDSQN